LFLLPGFAPTGGVMGRPVMEGPILAPVGTMNAPCRGFNGGVLFLAEAADPKENGGHRRAGLHFWIKPRV